MALEVLSFVKAAWIVPLWKRLRRIREEEKQELERLRDEFVDPETLRGLYIEPFLQDRNPADVQQDDLLSAARQPAFERINEFFQGGLPLEKDGRHQMFILSDAGMGKTSLLLMIKLMHLTSFWPQGHGCALFKLGADTLERVQALPNKGGTVLLLDALDEDPLAWKRIRDRLLELLRASEDFRRVLISSRTQFFPEMEPDRFGRPEIRVLSGYHCPVLYLSPFTDAQAQDFIERKLPLRWHHHLRLRAGTIRKERAKADCLLKHMQDLRMRPMLLQHIDKLLAKDCRQDWNAYTVYEALLEEWLDREVRKLREQHKERRVPERKELFLACLRIAERMQRQGTRVISEDELKQLISADANIAWLEQFELGGRSLLNRNSDRAFRFSHYTVQEFLLAWGIVHKQLTEQEPLWATDQLVRFVDLADGIFRHVDQIALPCPLPESFGGGLGIKMILIRGGSFRMGDIQGNDSEDERPVHEVELDEDDLDDFFSFEEDEDKLPVHEVVLDSFALGRYPVTFAEYDAFCEATGKEKPKDEGWGRAQRPVIRVCWHDAVAYCAWLRQETGQPYRLPTEAEWEYACRAGSEAAWCFGDDEAQLEDYAWYKKNSGDTTHPVGEKKANVWGLHDMHGNVREWCADWYDAGYYAVSPKDNPLGPESGLYRVLRGGSWDSTPKSVRAANRDVSAPGFRDYDLGFRLALSLPPAQR
ncbi:MAG: Formylglycine-generating enzyme, required for sulfatase activity, contains SUMF1/FGE domain [Candidatus Electronema aureum]|uniref:Formylglycine-generating enzyme, required for sulfatase activity, contains SUMF1/FGE domain n=1 Tax=Candidatus Electronema aureum TaxID=2005002 RepID=A0A521G5B8_9BACT|nr:MAG: Formylglycine-generating enzyme, required for sulfatase activity, contains SUMF1/FGE domain [Candidatus Electronema aureum]